MLLFFSRLYYSFPVQLLLLQLKHNLILLFFWILLAGMISGLVGDTYGIRYLFLDPEYLGHVNFWSCLLVGLSFSGFFTTWNLTCYIINGYHFPFLASLRSPFTKFLINNSLIPIAFAALYTYWLIRFQWFNEFSEYIDIVGQVVGFYAGFALGMLLVALYFHITNKDISTFQRVAQRTLNKALQALILQRRDIEQEETRNPLHHIRVDVYVTERIRLRLVRDVRHYHPVLLESVFRQNHANALVLQIAFISLLLLSAAIETPWFRIPAGATIFILFAVLTTLVGAFTYWLRGWRTSILWVVVVLVNYLTGFPALQFENAAYGLDYKTTRPKYTNTHLDSVACYDHFLYDKQHTLKILDNWRKAQGQYLLRPPKMVVVTASGGGLRAAAWSFYVLQQADSTLRGQLMRHTVLMTGSSGGMLGLGYLRELYLQQRQGKTVRWYHRHYYDRLTRDLLNPLSFTYLANDVFLPWVRVQVGRHRYLKDRGYSWEQQFIENTEGTLDRTLGYYRLPEEQALIPLMVITPVVISDARQLIISPQPMSYLMRPLTSYGDSTAGEVDAIDFVRFFREQDALSLRFVTALRMSATFPYILPAVSLPSQPTIEVMDAGFRDNYGTQTAFRFIHVFRDWILQHTSGVVIVQIRDSQKNDEPQHHTNNLFKQLFNPLGALTKIGPLQDYHHDNYFNYLRDQLGHDRLHIVRFTYDELKGDRASVNFHLTTREKNEVRNSFYSESNQEALIRLKQLLR